MNHQKLFASSDGKPVSVAVAGVGEFGASLAIRGLHNPALQVGAFADVNIESALRRLEGAGIARDQVAVCTTEGQAVDAMRRGQKVLVHDAALLPLLPVDVIVEATGNAEAAAACGEAAIAHGKHVAMATKEADSVVGPLLHRKALAAGVVYTPVDGDQPSLLIKLIAWTHELGARVVAAGKASEYDFIYDPQRGTVASQGQTVESPAMRDLWQFGPQDGAATILAREQALQAIARISVPDLCEMAVVANATGLMPDRASLHAPIARTIELPDLFCARADGGLFEREGVVDTFNCLRRPDEISFAGGVFVVADIGDDATFEVLKGKGIPASRQGSRLLLFNPTHLLGVEATISILAAARLRMSTLPEGYAPRVDLAASAVRDLPAGTQLAIAHQHTHSLGGLQAQLLDAGPFDAPGAALPYYMAVGRTLVAPLAAGQTLTAAAVDAPADSTLWRLRREQDRMFFAQQ